MNGHAHILTVEGGDYEHTLSLSSLRDGCDIRYTAVDIPALYRRVLGNEKVQFCEFSLSNLMMMYDRGRTDLVALPIFPNRAFRHGSLLVRRASSFANPQELRGLKIGVVDYSMTAAVWLRALLLEEFNLSWRDLIWVYSGEPRFPSPAAVNISRVTGDLEDMLAEGEIAALVHPHSRDATLVRSQRRFRPLIEDHVFREQAYFERTHSYPINHVLIASRELIDSVPRAARAVFDAYISAKRAALKRRLGGSFMPWSDLHWREVLERFGDPYPFGWSSNNIATINTLAMHLQDQELVSKPVDLERIFLPQSMTWQE